MQKGTFPLPKSNRKEHLEENLVAFEFRIGDRDMNTLDDLNEPYSSLGPAPEYL